MSPESHENQQAAPQNLPTASALGASGSAAAAQAQQLVAQYGHDPYRLNEVLTGLRMSSLAQQYHIIPNKVDQ